ncbi:MAG TPA: SIMPL domain-containing protein [Casimicrobiaceae bacterium]|nr:SIMPL domain-containing protein [Casimicrobiaceae bacterium]
MKPLPYLAFAWLAMTSFTVCAQGATPRDVPTVTVTASATASVANDRLQAWLRTEAEHVDPAAAANQVNAAMAKALARAKGAAGVTVATSGYSTQQITEKGRPTRWRVTQTMTISGADFAAITTLLTRLQEQDGMLLSGMSFSLSPSAREQAERTLIQQAIRAWQSRAQVAAAALGFENWRAGHVNVQTSEPGRVFPMRAAAMSAAEVAPVQVEAGMTDVTVTVSGDAVLETTRNIR